jgi:hypothetical protein
MVLFGSLKNKTYLCKTNLKYYKYGKEKHSTNC